MPKSTQTTSSASRHSLRRNQVQFFTPCLSRLFTPRLGLSHLSETKTGRVSIFLSNSHSSDRILFRGVMPHVRTVQHASSTYSGPPPSCAQFNTSADNGMLRSACRLRQDTRGFFGRLLIHLSHIAFSRRHPTEPQCSYDPVEGLPLAADADPIDKIRELEEQVGVSIYYCPCSTVHFRLATLTRRLKSQRGSVSPSRSVSPNHLRPPIHHINHSPSSATITLSPEFEPSGIATTPNAWADGPLDPNAVPSSKSIMGSPRVISPRPPHSDALSGLIHSGWNPDLPEPAVLDH